MSKAEYCDDCEKLTDDRDGSCECVDDMPMPVIEQIREARIENFKKKIAEAKSEIMALKADAEHYEEDFENLNYELAAAKVRESKAVNQNISLNAWVQELEEAFKEIIREEDHCCYDINVYCPRCVAEEMIKRKKTRDGELKGGVE